MLKFVYGNSPLVLQAWALPHATVSLHQKQADEHALTMKQCMGMPLREEPVPHSQQQPQHQYQRGGSEASAASSVASTAAAATCTKDSVHIGRQHLLPVVGLSLLGNLDHQSMLLSSANFEGFYRAARVM